jgi:hypothetical protein
MMHHTAQTKLSYSNNIQLQQKQLMEQTYGEHASVMDPDTHEIKIRIRINLPMTNQDVCNMSLFEHFFKGLKVLSSEMDPVEIRLIR